MLFYKVQASEESTISGYLSTRKGKKWQKRWYVVKDNVLYAYKASSVSFALIFFSLICVLIAVILSMLHQ